MSLNPHLTTGGTSTYDSVIGDLDTLVFNSTPGTFNIPYLDETNTLQYFSSSEDDYMTDQTQNISVFFKAFQTLPLLADLWCAMAITHGTPTTAFGATLFDNTAGRQLLGTPA